LHDALPISCRFKRLPVRVRSGVRTGRGGPCCWIIVGPPQQPSTMPDTVPVLTIDGPSGSGKGTISRLVARRLGWHYLDSGALYRAVGVAAGWAGIDLDDAGALVRCAFDTRVDFHEAAGDELRVLVNGHDATDDLRTETAG